MLESELAPFFWVHFKHVYYPLLFEKIFIWFMHSNSRLSYYALKYLPAKK